MPYLHQIKKIYSAHIDEFHRRFKVKTLYV